MKMKVFNKGQIVIPVDLRDKYGIKVGDILDVTTDEKTITLIPTKKENITRKLFGILAEYKKGKPALTKHLIYNATEQGFTK